MNLIYMLLFALGTGGLIWAGMEAMRARAASRKLETILGDGKSREKPPSMLRKLMKDPKDERRRKVEETLRKVTEKKKKRVTLRLRLQRAGLQLAPSQFLLFSAVLGGLLGILGITIGGLIFGLRGGLLVGLALTIIGGVGLPLWLLYFLTRRRMDKFLHHLPDAIELMVRGLRSGLPVTDAMKTIAEEVPEPVGPEFLDVVEGQKLGIPMEKGLERMHERVPLPEVNFLQIVVSIQRETGGNLSEALANLASVLRARKALKLKVKSITQEAKVSAVIIGAIPFFIIGALAVLNPDHLQPLITTKIGNILAVFSAVWMLMGILVMRKMINFKY